MEFSIMSSKNRFAIAISLTIVCASGAAAQQATFEAADLAKMTAWSADAMTNADFKMRFERDYRAKDFSARMVFQEAIKQPVVRMPSEKELTPEELKTASAAAGYGILFGVGEVHVLCVHITDPKTISEIDTWKAGRPIAV